MVRYFVSKKLFIAEIGERLFYKIQDTVFEMPQGKRARIDVNSDPSLKKLVEDQEEMQLPRVMIDDNGEIIRNESPKKVNKKQLKVIQQQDQSVNGMSPRGGSESLNVSVRSDAKFFASERKDQA